MSEPRVVTLECLLRRLEEVLGRDDLLFRRFQQGLQREDERALTDAMHSLRLYPAGTRLLVEDTVMGWLFGSRDGENEARRGVIPHG